MNEREEGQSRPLERHPFDTQTYLERSTQGPCFICQMLDGDPAYAHPIFFEDAHCVAFLNKYPTLYGYALVAPRAHLIGVTADFTLEAYLHLQSVLYRVAEAVRLETACERVYLLSLGSHQGNAHVHWHVAPLPTGVPYAEQQFEALRAERGVLELSEHEVQALAARLARRMVEAREV